MKKLYNLRTLLLFTALGWHACANAQTTFGYTGASQTWTVPAGVTMISIDAQGAQGGQAGPSSSLGATTPGCGGRVQANMAVTPGMILTINVGGVGGNGDGSTTALGGYNGGGNVAIYTGAIPFTSGGGGGGKTDISVGLTPVIVAGGGGGAGYNSTCAPANDQHGGDGGGTIGATVTTCTATLFGAGYVVVTPSGGGTGAAGGNGGNLVGFGDVAGSPGTAGTGGNNNAGGGIGGGGGAGLYGGGGGCWMGGGGGSSFTNPLYASGVIHTQGSNCGGSGSVSICAPNPGTIVGPLTLGTCSTILLSNPSATPGGSWTTTAPAVASIDGTGTVYGIGTGTANISYTVNIPGCGSAYATVTVTVTGAPAAIAGPSLVCMGNNITLTDATPFGTWSSSVPGTAVIDPVTGLVTPVGPGTTVISYSISGGCAASMIVTVNPAITGITGPRVVCSGGSTIVLSDPTPGGTWSSNDTPIATVLPSGLVTSGIAGNTFITYATSPGCYDTLYIYVNTAPTPLFPTSAQVCQGNTLLLTELLAGGVWSSAPSGIVNVFPFGTSGFVFGTSPGSATVSYTIPGCPPTTSVVTVNPIPAPITGITAICNGVPTTLYDAAPGGVWTTGNSAIATVDTSGVVTGFLIGYAVNIYYTFPSTGCFVSAPVNVDSAATPIIGPDSVCLGSSTTLMDTSYGGLWSTTSLATAPIVAATGYVTGVAAGTVNISYTLPTGCYAYKSFTVSPLVPATVGVTQSAVDSICAGQLDTLIAVAGPTAGFNPTLMWARFGVIDTTIDSTVYVDTTIHGDVITCIMIVHNVCAVHDTVIDTIPLNVYPVITRPTITINLAPGVHDSALYLGDIVTLYSTVIHGGAHVTYQWYMNGLPAPGVSTNSTYAATLYRTESFYCVVTGNPPCDVGLSNDTSNTIVIIGDYLGVKSNGATASDLSLFPNPNNGSFTLSGTISGGADHEVSIDISDMLGRTVYSGKANPINGKLNTQIELSNVAPGSYLMHVQTSVGDQVFHFVVAR